MIGRLLHTFSIVAVGRSLLVALLFSYSVIALFEAAQGRFGALHGVVNNAGIVAEAQDVADMTTHRLRTMFDTNILGAFLVGCWLC